jgi:nucleoside-diphosphate-sugar epimerase
LKVLVTGATGFIGSHLLPKLVEKGYHCRCLIRKESNLSNLRSIFKQIELFEGDLTLKHSLSGICQGVDIVIHLASQLGEWGIKDSKYYEVNVKGTENILDECLGMKIQQFIYCSTPGVLGLGKRLAKEEEEHNPRALYEKTKSLAEKTVITFCKNNNINYTILRPDFVYGIGDKRRIRLYKNIKKRKFVLINNGKSFIHPTYIDDLIDGFLLTINNKSSYNDIFNLAGPRDVTVEEFINTICKNVNSKMLKLVIPYQLSKNFAALIEILFKFLKREPPITKSMVDFLTFDHSSCIEKANERLGFKPQYDLSAGLNKTISWLESKKLI